MNFIVIHPSGISFNLDPLSFNLLLLFWPNKNLLKSVVYFLHNSRGWEAVINGCIFSCLY